jgi:hypothetical protein
MRLNGLCEAPKRLRSVFYFLWVEESDFHQVSSSSLSTTSVIQFPNHSQGIVRPEQWGLGVFYGFI